MVLWSNPLIQNIWYTDTSSETSFNGTNSKRTRVMVLMLGEKSAHYAKKSTPQNTAGWLVLSFRSTCLIFSMSSFDISKSNTSKFSRNLSCLEDFGMITVFLWTPHLSASWATVFLYLEARSYLQEEKNNHINFLMQMDMGNSID